jgi:cytohesin
MRSASFCCGLVIFVTQSLAQTADQRLIDAAIRRNSKAVSAALTEGASVDARDNTGRTALIIAIEGSASEYRVIGSDEATVQVLLASHANVNAQDNEGWSPLLKLLDQWADQPKLVELLIARGANVNARLKDGRTSLMLAARLGKEDRIPLLLAHSANPNLKDSHGRTALMTAITARWEEQSLHIAESLITNGADVNALDSDGHSAATLAAESGFPERVKYLLTHGAKGDETPLLKTARNNALLNASIAHDNIVIRAMLEQGADPNFRSPEGATALMLAIDNDANPETIALMLEKRASVNVVDRDKNTPLMFAADRFSSAIVKLLLDRGADVKARDKDNNTPLLRAAASRRSWDEKEEALIPSLLEEGSDPNARNSFGVTALMLTAQEGTSAVSDLLGRKAEVNARDAEGNTPLLYATRFFVRWEQRKAGEALIQAGADVNATNRAGETPLMRASRQYEVEGPKLLLDKSARINAADQRGRTPLMYAIDGPKDFDNTDHLVYSEKIAEFLVERGADVNAHDKQGMTALKLATQRGYTNMTTFLREHGAKE